MACPRALAQRRNASRFARPGGAPSLESSRGSCCFGCLSATDQWLGHRARGVLATLAIRRSPSPGTNFDGNGIRTTDLDEPFPAPGPDRVLARRGPQERTGASTSERSRRTRAGRKSPEPRTFVLSTGWVRLAPEGTLLDDTVRVSPGRAAATDRNLAPPPGRAHAQNFSPPPRGDPSSPAPSATAAPINA